MFQKLKDKVFWKIQFDSEWRTAGTFFNFIKFHYTADQKIKEKKYLWREEKGKYFSPRLAAFKAYEEFSNEYYREHHGRSDAECDFTEIGKALEHAAPYLDEDGNYRERESYLSDRWKKYLEKYRIAYKKNQEMIERLANEVMSFRFDESEIDAAWNDLTNGNIPEAATRIWRASHPRKSALEIADEADVSMSDFVFWMCVFRRHLYMVERVVSGTHMYYRQEDNDDLSSVILLK